MKLLLNHITNKMRGAIRRFIGVEMLYKEFELINAKFADLSEIASLVAKISTAEYIENNMVMAKALNSKFEVFDFCFSQEDKLTDGLVCEFGVYKGETINYIAKKLQCDVFGFDSFEGLPENWRNGFEQGIFKINKESFSKYENNIQIIQGLFNQSLPIFLSNHAKPISFLHIDCDLYSSTKTIFDLLGDRLLPGTIIVFDEYFNYPSWKKHEYLAFSEFINNSTLNCEYLCYNKFHEQVAVKLI